MQCHQSSEDQKSKPTNGVKPLAMLQARRDDKATPTTCDAYDAQTIDAMQCVNK